jgi:hypothetical protein
MKAYGLLSEMRFLINDRKSVNVVTMILLSFRWEKSIRMEFLSGEKYKKVRNEVEISLKNFQVHYCRQYKNSNIENQTVNFSKSKCKNKNEAK